MKVKQKWKIMRESARPRILNNWRGCKIKICGYQKLALLDEARKIVFGGYGCKAIR
jgi:hypothetical protein